jgi:hypothetical protein
MTIIGAAQKIALVLVPFVAQHRDRFGVEQKTGLLLPGFLLDPGLAQLLH